MSLDELELFLANCEELRQVKGLSKVQVARRIGISKQALDALFNSKNPPNFKRILELASALEVRPCELLMTTEERALWLKANNKDDQLVELTKNLAEMLNLLKVVLLPQRPEFYKSDEPPNNADDDPQGISPMEIRAKKLG